MVPLVSLHAILRSLSSSIDMEEYDRCLFERKEKKEKSEIYVERERERREQYLYNLER